MTDQSFSLEDLITDLMYLRKSEGFTITRARNASTLLDVMGGAGQTFDELKTRFVSAICSLEDEQSVTALLIAYGLEPGYEEIDSIYERRKKYGKTIGRKYDTLADREQTAIEELAVRMLMAQWVNAPLPANVPVIHGALITESLDVVSVIKDRTMTETRETQKFIALVDGIDAYDYSINELSEVKPIEGCTIESYPIHHGMKNVLRFPQPLKRGQVHTISFIELSPEKGNNGRKAVAIEIARPFPIPTFKYNLEIVFEGQKPKTIWSYKMLTLLERPGRVEERRLLAFKDGEDSIKVSFSHLHAGLFTGVAWEW
ncbi:MAG: hypothetical protein AAGU14_03920 [Eubacteriaceae bacterium]